MLEATPHAEPQKPMAEDKAEILRREVHTHFEGFLDKKLMEECQ